MKTAIGMARINLKTASDPYLITGIVLALGAVNYILSLAIPGSSGNTTVALGNYLFLLPLLMAIYIPAKNFTKLMHLGGKRIDFFKGAILTYLPSTVFAALVSLAIHYTIDPIILKRIAGVFDLYEIFGFLQHNVIVAFIQMTAFLLMFSCVLHTLTLIQGKWYGWVIDVVIVAIISVFTPIAHLRAALVWFFRLIIFNDSAIIQIGACAVLGAAAYCISLIPIKSKQI